MDRAKSLPASLPSRRRLLQSAALATLSTALLPTNRAGAEPQGIDYPQSEWSPANESNYTVANRPTSHPVDFVIIHVTQATYPDTVAIFQNPKKQVSAHYVVRSADGHIAQMVRERDIAWHAGNWDYNTRSIGIEHEGWVDQPAYFTDALYEESARLTSAVCAKYSIPKDRSHILAHYEVPDSDHTDPGPNWDWTRYMRLVNFA
ncbi:peptidoglycan recognition family protein [Streptomyces sp. NPDC048484]|uniref:N-acetylmuramoyl-L-alanine amidase n=1 Tax=Streptomyces sp. NPDC048484 TaxID=3155146 RepID=UPI0034409CE0